MANLHGLTNLVADSYSVIDGSITENLDDRYLRVGFGGAKGDKGAQGNSIAGAKGIRGERGLDGAGGVDGSKGAKGNSGTGGSISTSDQTWITQGKLNLTQDNLGAVGGITALRFANDSYMRARNSSGTDELFLYGRTNGNVTILKYGSAGFQIQNNSGDTALDINADLFVVNQHRAVGVESVDGRARVVRH